MGSTRTGPAWRLRYVLWIVVIRVAILPWQILTDTKLQRLSVRRSTLHRWQRKFCLAWRVSCHIFVHVWWFWIFFLLFVLSACCPISPPGVEVEPCGYPPKTGIDKFWSPGPTLPAGYCHVDDRVRGYPFFCRVPGYYSGTRAPGHIFIFLKFFLHIYLSATNNEI